MSKARRPWKVGWFSFHWNENMGASFATEERAVVRALLIAELGADRVRVWKNDEQGYVVPGSMRQIATGN